jgi:hypothetical protein
LIQNASDAVRARRLLEGKPSDWGHIIVRSDEDDTGRWLEVEDCGIGMSIDVLTGPLLDFGTSFWSSPLMHSELPGLESKGFCSSGQFGIGFFSVFMWGERVQVITRRAERARNETVVLEFYQGLNSRPILRNAKSDEFIFDGGTKVKVWMKDAMIFHHMLSQSVHLQSWTLQQKCAWLCPTLDVKLYIETDKRTLVVGASDWCSIKGKKLIERLIGPLDKKKDPELSALIEIMGSNLKLIKDSSGHIIGRACLDLSEFSKSKLSGLGIVTVGGFRSCLLKGISGVLLGNPHTAVRDLGIPVADENNLEPWISEQVNLAYQANLSSKNQAKVASFIRSLRGNTKILHISESSEGWKSAEDIAIEVITEDEILIVQDAALILATREAGPIIINKNVFAVDMGMQPIIRTSHFIDWPPKDKLKRNDWPIDWEFHSRTLEGELIEAIAAAWKMPLKEILKESEQSTDKKPISRTIGHCTNGKPILLNVTLIKKPRQEK